MENILKSHFDILYCQKIVHIRYLKYSNSIQNSRTKIQTFKQNKIPLLSRAFDRYHTIFFCFWKNCLLLNSVDVLLYIQYCVSISIRKPENLRLIFLAIV